MSHYNFTPLTDEQLNAIDIVPDGVYDFQVIKSTRKDSKAGNPMAALQLMIWDKEGKERLVFDYLVFSQVNLNIKKLSHFCKAVGLEKEYLSGKVPEDLTSYSGKVIIGTQDEMPNPTGGVYAKKNIVVDYVKRDSSSLSGKDVVTEFKDDEIPF